MQHKDCLCGNDDFDPEEAMEAPVDREKILIKKLLKGLFFYRRRDDEDN